jgi:hypothetical protein
MTIQAIPNPPQDDIGTIRTLRSLTPLIIGTFAEAKWIGGHHAPSVAVEFKGPKCCAATDRLQAATGRVRTRRVRT